MTEEEIREHITWLLSLIGQIRTAIFQLSSGTQRSYTINDGQIAQSVTKKDIGSLRDQLNGYISDLATYRAMLGGAGTVVRSVS